MTECESAEMRDVLPDLIHGRLGRDRVADVEAHVAFCAECAAEIDLLKAVLASAPCTPELDLNRIVNALPTPTGRGLLLHQGGGQPVGSRKPQTFWSRPLLRVAAAAAIITAGGMSLLVGRDALDPERQARPPIAPASATAVTVSPAPGRLATPAAASADHQVPAGRLVASTGLSLAGGEVQDLSDEHLATLLSEMDRLDPIPAAEPEALTPSIGASDSSGMIQ
ncbi:MAG: hypothetical protein ABI875_03490 [Gemmatimonadales bacterium]